MLEQKLFKAIDSREFLNGAWMKDRAKNIALLIEHFNKISKYVVLEIVQTKDIDHRAAIISCWINIAEVNSRYILYSYFAEM